MFKAEWTNADALDLQPTCNQLSTNLISKQSAIDSIMEEPSEVRYPCFYAEKIKQLPSEQQDLNKQELIRTITAGIVATNTKDVYSCGMRNGMRWCRSLLEEDPPKFEDASLYAQAEQKWIPVTEGLPKYGEEVNVSVCDESGDTKYDYTSHGWLTPGDEYWIVNNEINYYVVAWQPLPKPYERNRR